MSENPLFGDSRLPPDLDARVRADLRDGERLLWVGQPHPGRFARAAIPLVLFGIPWTAFAVFWMLGASGILFGAAGGRGGLGAFAICFPMFGLPFVLIGVAMLSSPYWLKRLARRTCYALTDRRAVLWQAGWSGSVEVRSYGPAELTKIVRTEHADGTGDLVFEEEISLGQYRNGRRVTHSTRRGFLAIGGVREIEELLHKALLAGREESTGETA